MAAVSLVGRSREADVIVGLLDDLPERGGTLVVRGEAGIGKSALLEQARTVATDRRLLVMSVAGVQSEASLPFAGLHRLLRPVLGYADDLPPFQRDALMAAFGMLDAAAPDPFLIAMAALELLSAATARAPIVLVVEDAHWLDRPSSDALAFVGRRVESDPIVLLATIRAGYDSGLLDAGLAELQLDRLADRPASELLDVHFPDLAPAVRERLLNDAAGNPLALLELPLALDSRGREGAVLPVSLPLTTRLEQAFASRAAELPSATRTLLRVAAVDDGDVLAEVLSAAEIVCGVSLTVEALVPAVEAQLVEVNGHMIRFRHPLVRSAIHQAASVAEQHSAHEAFAEVLAHDPDRRVWHRAAAALGTDPEVASELEQAAGRAQRRGAIVAAVAAFERAAALTAEPARRGALLLRAAELSFELGRSELVIRLLREADSLELASHDRARSMWLGEAFHQGVAGDPARVHAVVETAERMLTEGDTDVALDLLSAVAFRCWGADPGEQARREVLAAADRIGVGSEDPRLVLIQAFAAPIERGSAIIEQLASSAPG
ncbi:MAG TPA: AAA family ATPase, partial [Solirubrobacteraceae bacterium]